MNLSGNPFWDPFRTRLHEEFRKTNPANPTRNKGSPVRASGKGAMMSKDKAVNQTGKPNPQASTSETLPRCAIN